MKKKKEIEYIAQNSWNYMGHKKGPPLKFKKRKDKWIDTGAGWVNEEKGLVRVNKPK